MRTIVFFKRCFFTVLLVAMTLMVSANPVDIATARQVGAKFLHASALLRTDDPSNLQLVKTYRTANNDAAFYVFNTTDGFVIVSADDCATPILGYSNESVFTVDDVPIQMEDYLQQFVKQIQYGIDNHFVDDATVRQWELVRATGFINEERGTSAVAPLLTDTWGQGCYYNDKCPSDANGPCGHVYTGCVATSFAQILHYWGYPATGTGSHSYTPEGYPQQTVNFGATTYQWNNMPNSLSASSLTTQVNAVSTLMWHCGVAVEMSYGINGSAAFSEDILPALVNYFGYATDASIIYRDYYTSTQWLTLIKNCLNLGRPVHYRGTDENGGGGHAFVCDGYDNNNYLHFNWGWNGYCNNYFADGALNPDDSAYNLYNAAIINIHPLLPSYQVTISSNPSNGGTVSFGAKGERETTTYDFEDGSMMNWTSLDADGDGYGWVSSTEPGQYHNSGVNLAGSGHGASQAYVISGSYSNSAGIPLTPDNYLISPSKAAYSQIGFYACAQDAAYAAEHFGIAVSTTGNTSASNFTTIQEWTLTAKDSGMKSMGRDGDSKTQGIWYNFNVDLSAYAGQQIWVAIRHFNCTDQFILNIDDITLTTGGGGGGNSSSAYFEQGQSCTVTATPSSGYYFANWTENGTVVSGSASYNFTVNGTRNLVANFTTQPLPQQYTISISANPTNGGSVAFGSKGERETTTYDFEDGTMMSWTSLDADGDGYGWVSSTEPGQYHNSGVNLIGTGHESSQAYVLSGSYSNSAGIALTPNNFLISPSKAAYSQISFYASAQDASYAADHFGVAVSTTGNTSASNFTIVQEWTMTAKGEKHGGPRGLRQGNWYEFTADLSAYAGQDIWVAIRHFNCTDMFILNVDDITLITGGGGGGNTSSAVYTEGQSCTVIATANSGYTFSNWTENGTVVSSNPNYTFTVNGNRNLVANFTVPQPQQYTISVSASPSNGGTVGGGGTFNQGTNCTVTAMANSGYTFSNWTENGTVVSSNANYTFTVNGNRTLVANFTQIPSYTITVSADPANGGTVSGGGTYLQGATCLLTATPNNGFVFSNWTQNGTVITTNPSINITVSGDATYVAHFVVQTNNYTITVSADPVEGGVVSGSGTYEQGAVCTLSATANTGYQFENWTKNGTIVSSNPSFSFNVTENATYVAHFSILTFTISVSANPVEGGLVTGGGVYNYGATVTVSVTPNDQYLFLNWTENWAVVSEELTYSFVVTSDRVLVAQLSFVDGIQENESKCVRAYPNPAHDKLFVECGQHIIGCELYSADGTWMGKVEPEAMKAEISLHNLPSGMYLVKIVTEDKVLMTRFVKE